MVFEGLSYAHGVLLDRFGENRTVSGAAEGFNRKCPYWVPLISAVSLYSLLLTTSSFSFLSSTYRCMIDST
ncbi:hypothetical protein ACVSMD_10015, partial [Pseudomonas aeruginosa]